MTIPRIMRLAPAARCIRAFDPLAYARGSGLGAEPRPSGSGLYPKLLAFALACAALPFAAAESLTYSVNWSSGLSLGEATLSSTKSADPNRAPWTFDLSLDASVPGFAVRDHYRSTANAEFCSARLDKETAHGSRKVKEKITFDQQKHTAERETEGGGHSSLSTSSCAHDALAFLQFVRQELQQGRLAPQQSVVFGGQYQIRFDYMGVQRVSAGSATNVEAERIQATVKGPATNFTFELFFSRDAARTPLLARVPLPVGALTVELTP